MKNKNHHGYRILALTMGLLFVLLSPAKLMSESAAESAETNRLKLCNAIGEAIPSDVNTCFTASSQSVATTMLDVVATEISDQAVLIEWNQNESTAVASFSIYRTSCETAELYFLGNSTANSFVDNSWGAVGSGVYKWAVMDENMTISYSNCLDKDMVTQLSVTVSTNSQDSPAGTQVVFTNISEPALGLVYDIELDDSGYYFWEEFRKGTYDIQVEKAGFSPVLVSDYLIDEAEDFQWVLVELFLPVEDLFVNPNGYAVWSTPAGGAISAKGPNAAENTLLSEKQNKFAKPSKKNNTLRTSEKTSPQRSITGYKLWLDGLFMGETQENSWQFDETNLITGQTYLTEVAAVYTNGISEKEAYSWSFVPCADYAGPQLFTIDMLNYYNNDVLLTWSDIEPMELVRISQNPGEPEIAYWQEFGYGYGVVYDLSSYPDAVLSSLGFHHMSFGHAGIWDFKVHVYDWENETLLESLGPYQTTGDDQWETDISLNSIMAGGISTIAILIEPLGNLPFDAYPCLSADQASDPQGSIFGSLSDVNAFSSSTLGNFLMELYIYTRYGTRQSASSEASLVKAPMADINIPNAFDHPVGQLSGVQNQLTDSFVGAHIYRNGELIAEMLTDTFYVDHQVFGGVYNYCIRYVYESGAMTCEDAYCEEFEVPCASPKNMDGDPEWVWDNGTMVYGAMVEWSSPDISGWLYYDDGTNVEGIGGPAEFSWAIKFDPVQLAAYEGTSLTKIELYNKTTTDKELRIYEGDNAATLLHSQMLSGLENEQWQAFFLTESVLVDVTKELWIAVHATDGVNEPAACGPNQNQPNGDLISMDGLTWEHLSDYGMNYTWNLRAFVTTGTGDTRSLSAANMNNTNYKTKTEHAVENVHQVLHGNNLQPDFYKLYRRLYSNDEYSYLHTLPGDTHEYFDPAIDWCSLMCYQVTAVYVNGEDTCESAPAFARRMPDEDFWCIFMYEDLNENDAVPIKMYPNPASNSLNIKGNEMRRLIVVNDLGQVVFETILNDQSYTLNTSDYESGIYLVRVVTAQGMVNKRLVVIKGR